MQSSHIDPAASVILWGTAILFLGIVGRFIAKRMQQPGVLGELLMGVLVGNLCYYFGMELAVMLRENTAVFHIMQLLFTGDTLSNAVNQTVSDVTSAQRLFSALSGAKGSEWIKVSYVVDIFSRYGVIFLLFMVGLESSINELKKTGRAAFQVALIGVIAPILLGLLTIHFLVPALSFNAILFVAASLSATSVGITARVLKDMHQLNTREAKTILGAAMIDDILGLLILAIVSGMVIHGAIEPLVISQTILFSVLFFIGALLIGPWILRGLIQWFSFLDVWEAKLFTAFLFVMLMSWLAACAQLATIIGAFVAGVIIHDDFFNARDKIQKLSIKNLMAPLESIFAPLFFMLIGIQVKLETFLDWHVLIIAGGLSVVAVLGKLISGFGASRQDDRLLIGIGMLPRGEVGLVFASIGKTIDVINDQLFSAIILMVIITTFLTPPWLKTRYMKRASK